MIAVLLAVVLVAFLLVRRATTLHHERAVEAAKVKVELDNPKPVCTCEHGRNYHDANGCQWKGAERRLVKEGEPVIKQDKWGDWHKMGTSGAEYKTVETYCTCVEYVGPEPMPRFLP